VLESLRQLLHTIYDVQGLIQWGGTLMVCTIVFVETGLFVGFFLPGDSLLVTAGIFAAAGRPHLVPMLPLATLCAIVGDQLGYWIGRRAGRALFRREDSLLFKKRHLERAQDFYERHGGKAIILARFVPIVRTFCPPVAGAARMSYPRYFVYDIFGGFFWVGSMILTGYYLGRLVGPEVLTRRIHWVIAVVVLLSLLPAIIGALRARSHEPHKQAAPAARANVESGQD
jgi:membrane-associated protein